MTNQMTKEDKDKDNSWLQHFWRPMMGWMYMLICFADMIVFPVLWSLLQVFNNQPQVTQWDPLTLRGAGLFHIAMGAVLGIAAFGRTQEKLAGTAVNPISTAQTTTQNINMSGNVPGGYGSGQSDANFGGNGNFGNGGYGGNGFGSPAPNTGGFGAPAAGAFGSPNAGGFGAPMPDMPQPIATTANGKKIVPQNDQPAI